MPLTYTDKAVKEKRDLHPAYTLDKQSPMYLMIRYATSTRTGEKISVFKWTKEEAFAMYDWYVQNYRATSIVNEFDETIESYDWRDLVKNSHYEVYNGLSELTIEKAWLAEEDARHAAEDAKRAAEAAKFAEAAKLAEIERV